MSRHSKNNTANAVFTYHERRKLKYGTITERLGRDSIKDFDCCSLCLHPFIEPMCCKKGHIFCKECIFEYLLAQKQEITRQLEKYDEQEKRLKDEEMQKQQDAKQKEIESFEKTVLGILPKQVEVFESRKEEEGNITRTRISSNVNNNQGGGGGSTALVIYDNQDKDKSLVPVIQSSSSNKQVVSSTTTTTKDPTKKLNSFWVPGLTPEAPKSIMKKPITEIRCPEGADNTNEIHSIKLKQLIKLNFTPNNTSSRSSGDKDGVPGDNFRYQCGLCSKTITNSVKCSALKKCGHVMCNQCMKILIKDTNSDTTTKDKDKNKDSCYCPICNIKIHINHDIIHLSSGGTAFAGSSGDKLNAKIVTPTAWL